MSSNVRIAICLTLLIATLGCDKKSGESTSDAGGEAGASAQAEPRDLDAPTAQGSMAADLFIAGEKVGLSWIAPTGTAEEKGADAGDAEAAGHRLKFSFFEDGEWSKPAVIDEGDDFFANWADVPVVRSAGGGKLYAYRPKKSGEETYAYDVALLRSEDGGKGWTPLGAPHDDATKTEHGFVSMVPDGASMLVVWLDGRKMIGEPRGPMALRAARVGTKIGPSDVLDERVCECCDTEAVNTAKGPVVFYRDRTENEIRDIYFRRRTADGWSAAAPVHRDNWQIPGCPVNGPAADVSGDTVAVAWYTAPAGHPRVQIAFSEDGGGTFGSPVAVDVEDGEGDPLGRVDVVALDPERFVVLWLDESQKDAQVRGRVVKPNGDMSAPVDLARSSTKRSSGVPRAVRSGEELILAYNELFKDRTHVRVKAIPTSIFPDTEEVEARPAPSKEPEGPATLPKLALKRMGGLDTMLQADPERPTLINIWATWCAPCREEVEALAKYNHKHEDDLNIVGISLDEKDSKAVRELVEEVAITYEVLVDPKGESSRAFNAATIPANFLFDSEGKLVKRWDGVVDPTSEEFQNALKKASK